MELDNIDEITPEDSIVPVYLVPPTEEQELQWTKESDEFLLLEIDRVSKKESALAKLEKLGITQEELSALLG